MIDIFSATFLLGIIFGLLAGFTIKSFFSKKKESEVDVNDYANNLKDLKNAIDGYQKTNSEDRGAVQTLLTSVQTGQAAVKEEAERIAKMNALRRDEVEKVELDMPKVPEALSPPKSLGGLLNHIVDEEESNVNEDSTMQGLGERTAELTEDIQEMQDLKEALSQENTDVEADLPEVIDSQEEI